MSTLDPSNILKTGFAFWEAKVLLTAVELRVFTLLAEQEGPQFAAAMLVRAAVDAGGHDNVTALVVDVDAAPPTQGSWRRPDVEVEQPSAGTTGSARRWTGRLEQPFLSMLARLGRRR